VCDWQVKEMKPTGLYSNEALRHGLVRRFRPAFGVDSFDDVGILAIN
jgi:hypothetical protein